MYSPLLLTKSTAFIIGPIAEVLGWLMNAIFILLNKIGIPNIGLAIIIFTLVIYMALLPLTIQQQKFSKLSNIMNPELQAIQKKYKGKTDSTSMARMQEETSAVYARYGVSPSGSCVQMLIQLPILFALYKVIYNVPAYVTQVKQAFYPLITTLISDKGAVTYLQGTTVARQFAKQFKSDAFVNNVGNTVANTCIDVLNRFSTGDWSALSSKFSNLSGDISNTLGLLTKYNNFLGLNIGNSPWFTFKNALAAGSILGIIAAILVPLLAAVTQLINVALMPQPQATSSDPNDQQSQMMNSMKTMNYMMPIMSAWFCATLPAGMGLYWIAGSVIRSIQQVGINKYINNMDMDAYIAKNVEKQKKKMEKNGGKQSVSQRILSQYSGMSTRNTVEDKYKVSDEEKKKQLENAQHYYESGKFRKGSLASKANMVNDFNNHKRDEQGKDNKN